MMDKKEAKEMLSQVLIDYFALRVNGVNENHLNEIRELRSNNFRELVNNAIENQEHTLEGIFFLNYDLDTCLKGVESRIGTKRSDIPWVEEEFDPEFKEWIINWFKDVLPKVHDLIEKYKNKNIIVFADRDEANNYLKKLNFNNLIIKK